MIKHIRTIVYNQKLERRQHHTNKGDHVPVPCVTNQRSSHIYCNYDKNSVFYDPYKHIKAIK